MYRPSGDVPTAAWDDASDAEASAAVHPPVVRENAVGRHRVIVLSHALPEVRTSVVTDSGERPRLRLDGHVNEVDASLPRVGGDSVVLVLDLVVLPAHQTSLAPSVGDNT